MGNRISRPKYGPVIDLFFSTSFEPNTFGALKHPRKTSYVHVKLDIGITQITMKYQSTLRE